MTVITDSIEQTVDQVLTRLSGDIVLAIPLGIGKPNHFVNALYRRIKTTPTRRLKIITALSLLKPASNSELEQRFLTPFVERVFGDYPDLDYALDMLAGTLPPNIEVLEFFFKTGDYLGNPTAQQQHICTNYTFVARDMALHGVNLVAQALAMREGPDGMRLSLSGNPDLTGETVERLRALPDHPLLVVGVVNRELPFMPNGAEIDADFFDLLLTDPSAGHALYAPPNMEVSLRDYAIGLHASTLVKDGGTLQIGIGSLGDAIAYGLLLREQHNDEYRRMLGTLGASQDGELGRFASGLYGCSEMFVNGLLKLLDAGIIRREVFDDLTLQRLLNQGRISSTVDATTLAVLHEAGRISSPLTAADVTFLRRHGIVRPEVVWRDGTLMVGERHYSAELDLIAPELLGPRLTGGIALHAGFFLGPRDFYQRLRTLPDEQLHRIGMSRIDFINLLCGPDSLASAQRRDARFMNTTMMVTLLGAAVSDGLDSGQVVSGVGGQFNFVSMGHDLPGARSVLLLRATREQDGILRSNIVWNYGHTTIPRHLRDVVVTEYGVADLRGQTDAEVIKRLLAVADSRFQDELLIAAKLNGKLDKDYHLPDWQRHNLPERLVDGLGPWREAGLLPSFPFGTDFNEDELAMIAALQKLRHASHHPVELLTMMFRGLFEGKTAPPGYLERLGLQEVHGIRQLLLRRLFVGNL
ncbi:acetyl-CoA hydrolase/transferase C-terminal domain-containing protein [Chitinimonas lacunae]|uniref:Acetyl-CoA hydrolase/transferase C-terminal domain-containing protein n=1 Tax=Chitinimonas lacunae TaxID=1963018 RepID=A0ABV8MP12_9NEIS